jgi:hypothetical protein
MAEFSLTEVQVFRRDDETGQVAMVKKNPYTRFVASGQAPVLCQDGGMFYDNGSRVPKAPEHIVEGLRNMTDAGRANIGFSKIPRVGENLLKSVETADDSPVVVEMEE